MALELDHVFCLVEEPGPAVEHLEADGWRLDPGREHPGQGTRNRRLVWSAQYFEVLWLTDRAEAEANPLRLDRRADWAVTGASPFGFGLRGLIDPAAREEFWLYDQLGPRIWIHRDGADQPERPLVFVLETNPREMEAQRPRTWLAAEQAQHREGELTSVVVRGPAPPALPAFSGPPVTWAQGEHHLELVVDPDGVARTIAPALTLRARAGLRPRASRTGRGSR